MIPKIIHLCWMSGDPYPAKIQKCIDSWKRILPDYQIRLWNADTFDINSSEWVKEAFEAKKYAFCADYIRMYALYHYGGIYLDSDVEVIKSYNDLLYLPYFIGFESKQYFEAATIGAEPHNAFIKAILDSYEGKHFVLSTGEQDKTILPVVMMHITEGRWHRKLIHNKDQFINDNNVINVFSYDFFSPIDSTGKRYVLRQTENTYSIHHFASAWVDWKVKLLVKIFGLNSPMRFKLMKLAKKLKHILN